jgi:predicted aldo/keto reductase-like oxidoreductase
MTSSNRRVFLKNSLLSASGTLFAVPGLSRLHSTINYGDPPSPIIKRKLGKTGIVLPIVSMGVMRADNPGLVRAALKAGITHFDTAHGYQKGKNEEMLGEVLMEHRRESFVIGTKIGPDSKGDFLAKLDLSLQRLKMAFVDILYLHGVSERETVLSAELMEIAKGLKAAGKVRHLGVSTHKNEPEVIQAAVDSGFYEVVLTSVNFRQDHYTEVRSAIARAAKAGVGIVAMKTMAGGFFDKDRKEPINCKAALKWVLQDENVSTSIPGITSYDMLAENATVNTDLTITDGEKAELRLAQLQGGLYCNACEECVATCSRSLPIPELMRAYMYTYGYGNASMGKELVTNLAVGAEPCSDCGSCTVRCTKEFLVRERISDVARLQAVPDEFLSGAEYA